MIVDLNTGQERIVEITRHEWMCERYGLPLDTPDAELEALHAETAIQAARAIAMEDGATALIERIARYNAQTVQSLILRTEDANSRAALGMMHGLLTDLRALLLAQVGRES